MADYKVGSNLERFVLYFDTPKHEINSYALATSLVGISDAIVEANNIINPGYRVEVVVDSLTAGSFKASVGTIYTYARNLFSNAALQNILLGIISAHIYETYIKSDQPPIVQVSADLVVVQAGNERIIIPKIVYDAKQQVERSERFGVAISRVFDAAQSDANVSAFGITENERQQKPPLIIPREKFAIFGVERTLDENSRELVEITQVEISRAILQRGRRRWEFFWRGVRISAPILDESFFKKFFAHEIKIAPGDVLNVALKIIQERHPDSGIYVNKRYEIMEVYDHIPRPLQNGL